MRNRRTTPIALAVTILLGVGGVVAAAASRSTDQVASVGVVPIYPVAPIGQGATTCQRPIGVTETFDRVRFNVGTFGHIGPPLVVRVVDEKTGDELGRGEVRAGWVDDGTAQNVQVGTVEGDHRVEVCFRNEGTVRAYVYGDYYNGAYGTGPYGVTPTNTANSAVIDGEPIEGDLSLALLSDEPRPLLARVPAIFEHASAFAPPILGPWTYWLLAALILCAAPIVLWKALARAAAAERSQDDRRYPDSSRP
jgi:hypothetical protein